MNARPVTRISEAGTTVPASAASVIDLATTLVDRMASYLQVRSIVGIEYWDETTRVLFDRADRVVDEAHALCARLADLGDEVTR